MIYNVAQLLKADLGSSQTVELDDRDALELTEHEADLAGPIRGRVKLHRTNQGVYADGMVTVPVHLQCTRCLSDFTTELTFPLREQFYPTVDVLTGTPVPPSADDLAFPIDRNHLLDLREAVRQNLVLALPIRALCREDCEGLCPHCGRLKSEGPCGCVEEPDDTRLGTLRDLLPGR